MAVVHPFKAWRPDPEQVEEIACVPYDVINTEEAQKLAEGKPHSFLHVIRPEIDLPEGTPYNDASVYQKGADNLKKLMNSEIFNQDDDSAVYVYRLIMDGRSQTGIFSCVSVEDYDHEVILKHELTRPDKEDDRTRHILTQSAHAEPVMLTYKDTQGIAALTKSTMNQNDPIYDFTAADGVQHTLWKIDQTKSMVSKFKSIEHLYVADGHHRCKSASRAAKEHRKINMNHTGNEEYNFFPAVLFPMDQMKILAYNRVIHQVPDNFLQTLSEQLTLRKNADPVPSKKGDITIYYDGNWYGATLPIKREPNSVDKLDVARLQQFLLSPLLNIDDPRRNENISFVGGIRGTDELKRRVDSGKAELAISMYPTDITELVQVSDDGLLMPPKSTWFEPKLRSGLLVHTF